MGDRHKRNPVRLRADQHEWLAKRAAETGRTLPEVLADAIDDYREQVSERAPAAPA